MLWKEKDKHIQLVRESNNEKYNDVCNKAQAVYYVKNRERVSQCKKE